MRKYKINLITKKKKSFIEQLMYFLLHYFRYIIVITQVIVISVFFARFKLDQDIIDYKESFQQKQEILTIATPLIEEAEALEFRGKQIKGILDQQDTFSSNIDYIFSSVPRDVSLSSFAIKEDIIMFEGDSLSLYSIKLFYSKLKLDNNYKSVQLIDISGSRFDGYSFSIKINT